MDDLICVFDVETTNRIPRPTERIVEFGAVLIDLDGNQVDTFETLINPCRDVGPTDIHGISASDVIHAPTFGEIAGDLREFIGRGKAVAAHNLRFDQWFLTAEFKRAGFEFPAYHGLCTLEYFGGRLEKACEMYDIDGHHDWHCALSDALATSKLVALMIDDQKDDLVRTFGTVNYQWGQFPEPTGIRYTRKTSTDYRSALPSYLNRLLNNISHDFEAERADVVAYLSIIENVLEDRVIDKSEEDLLVATATSLNLSRKQIKVAHRSFLDSLVAAALADGVVTDCEKKDLRKVAHLLGIPSDELDSLLKKAFDRIQFAELRRNSAKAEQNISGKTVCITGTLLSTLDGQKIDKKTACLLAQRAGMVPMTSVTKKLDVLVTADANTQSGKMTKARKYNVNVWDESVFWRKIGVAVD